MTEGGCPGALAGLPLPAPRLFSPAVLFGLAAFAAAALLLLVDPRRAPLPLLAFVLACMLAPLVPTLGFFLPIVSRGRRGERGVALTFDDGPDPEITPRLLELLDRLDVPATFFVTGEKAARHPGIILDIVSRGHAIGNHSFSHMPLLMLKGMRTLTREIGAAQSVLGLFGIVPLTFRPPVGVTNPHLPRVLLDHGLYCVNFSCRASDFGNRRVAGLAARALRTVTSGDIIALHDVVPPRAGVETLLREFESLIRGLREKQLGIVPLSRLIGREVMRLGPKPANRLAAPRDFDAPTADRCEERFDTAMADCRRAG